jgi:hypothetical protein
MEWTAPNKTNAQTAVAGPAAINAEFHGGDDWCFHNRWSTWACCRYQRSCRSQHPCRSMHSCCSDHFLA